eukprot:SAG31_NODE_741_length_12429_cov_13.571127_6_plen_148_part_00
MGMDRHCRSAAIRSIAALIYIVDFCASNALERPPPKRRMQADPCEDLDCGAHGSCHAGECVCSDFYRGTFCHITPSLCDGVWCSSAGTCVDGACHCDVGVTGDTCEVSVRPEILLVFHLRCPNDPLNGSGLCKRSLAKLLMISYIEI